LAFFGVFFSEVLVKITAFGIKICLKDPFQSFDAILIGISCSDVILFSIISLNSQVAADL
jgi:hypothetical protein